MERIFPSVTEINKYKRFFGKALILFSLIYILDYVIGNMLGYFYFRQDSGERYRITYAIERSTEDILIFGSSRATHHYNPEVFEKRLNLSCYNVGREGNFIIYHYAILKGVLKRYSPKIVILDLRSDEFVKTKDSYDKMFPLLPYYNSHPEMRPIINLRSPFEKYKLLSKIYPYNSSLIIIAVGNTNFNKKRILDIKGYLPLSGVWDKPITTDSNFIKYELDSTKIQLYKSFINDCINSRVKLYIICSPYFVKFTQKTFSLNIGRAIAEENNIEFYDYSSDSLFVNNSSLFRDKDHLNGEGAKIFSNIIVDKIRNTTND